MITNGVGGGPDRLHLGQSENPQVRRRKWDDMIHGVGLSGLASILVLGFMLQTATPPRDSEPHTNPDPSTSGGCEDVVAYVDDLFTTLEDHETFSDFWIAPDYDGIQQMDRADVEAIVDDGRALIEDMQGLTVPAAYAPGHEGLQLLFDADIDYVVFLGIDASTPPGFDQRDRAIARLLQGELAIVKTCPDEVAEVGDFIFYDPADLETYFD